MSDMKPFIRYYGGKYRAAPYYPKPQHTTLIEPFAGGAGYSLRYPDLNVILIEKYPVLVEMWRYLTRVSEAEILRIPEVEDVRDLPSWVPEGGRILVGFAMNAATTRPCKTLSAGRKKLRSLGRVNEGWSESHRQRVARQVHKIRHWRILEGDYTAAPNVTATWFIDPPYNNKAGTYYVHGPKSLDYEALAKWCRERQGQVLVCENEGADWLPFRFFKHCKSMEGPRGKAVSREVLWTNKEPDIDRAEEKRHES